MPRFREISLAVRGSLEDRRRSAMRPLRDILPNSRRALGEVVARLGFEFPGKPSASLRGLGLSSGLQPAKGPND
jgi:hypothetical protein